MKPKTYKYAILSHKVQRVQDLHALDLHNNRKIKVFGADPLIKGGVELLRMDGDDVRDAVFTRIKNSGAKYYEKGGKGPKGKGRVVAVEVLLGFTPGASQLIPRDVRRARCLAYCDRVYGRENVVAAWDHCDEKEDHMQVLVVPIVKGLPPGRPRADEDDPPLELVVSWNQFSGACDVDYRDTTTERVVKKPKRKARKKAKTKFNKVMAGWQSEYASEWVEYGMRRGVRSTRRQIPLKHVHGCQEAISGHAEAALKAIRGDAVNLKLADADLVMLREEPTEATVSKLLETHFLPKVADDIQILEEVAHTGIQFWVEKRARADLADEHNALKKQYEDLLARASFDHPDYKELTLENTLLKEELFRLRVLAEPVDSDAASCEIRPLPTPDPMPVVEVPMQDHEALEGGKAEGAVRPLRPISQPKSRGLVRLDPLQSNLPGFQ